MDKQTSCLMVLTSDGYEHLANCARLLVGFNMPKPLLVKTRGVTYFNLVAPIDIPLVTSVEYFEDVIVDIKAYAKRNNINILTQTFVIKDGKVKAVDN